MVKAKIGKAEAILDEMKAQIDEGKVPSKIFNSHDIYELEKETIFAKTWVFLAHETEIPNPGDYVVRYIVDDSFIVTRGEDGIVRVLFNSCRHRGMQVCNVEIGNSSHFRCPYHGWTYQNSGKLTGIPWGNEIYGKDGLNRADWGLIEVRSGICNKLVFACLDPDAVSLEEYIGDFKFYLDMYTNTSHEGLEVLGPPQRWVVDADWKLGADNFIGDGYHTAVSHHSAIDVGVMIVKTPDFLKDGVQVFVGNGGKGFRPTPPGTFMLGYPESMAEAGKQALSPEQLALLLGGVAPSHGTLFPNLSFLPAASSIDGRPVPYFTIRIWQPIGPGKMEIWSWCLVDTNAPEWFKEASRKSYIIAFGSSGVLEQDDTENWRSISRVSKGMMAEKQMLNFQMGMKSGIQPIPEWKGPGVCYPIDYIEANERAFMKLWLEHMTKSSGMEGEPGHANPC